MKVLIVDDDEKLVRRVEKELALWKPPDGGPVTCTGMTDHLEALRYADNEPVDIVVTDMWMGRTRDEGLELVKKYASRSAIVVVLTGHASISNCVAAMRLGAWDYIEKSVKPGQNPFVELTQSLTNACEYRLNNPDRGVENPDVRWTHEHLSTLMEQFPGHVVAVLYERVVDSDRSLGELSRRLEARFTLAKPTIISLPEPENRGIE